jgi:hypothetical protein
MHIRLGNLGLGIFGNEKKERKALKPAKKIEKPI